MAVKKRNAGDTVEVGGLTTEQWDERWNFVPNGFTSKQSDLRNKVGLFAAKLGQDFMYIGKAVQHSKGGLRAGLSRAYVSNISGDLGHGMGMIRTHIADVQAFVLIVPQTDGWRETVVDLKKVMIEHHKPSWNQNDDIIKALRVETYEKKS